MWFRNLLIYRIKDWPRQSLAKVEEQLARKVLQACGKLDLVSRGWVPPGADEGPLAQALQGRWMLALGMEQKLLPATVINQQLRDRAKEIAQKQGYAPGRKQLREMREQLVDELAPRALAKRSRTYLIIDPSARWLLVDAASATRGDEVVEALGNSVENLALAPLRTIRSPLSAMTEWLAAGEAPDGFSIDREAELRAPGAEKSTIRYLRHALEGEELSAHLAAGMQVSRLALTWREHVSFVLDEDLRLKRLIFADRLKEEASKQGQQAEEQFEADFAILAGELFGLLPDLVRALGGE
ncbi:MAG: recombination-associated protein RdgC [Betaproteobacteria bacterium]|nr:recombination-associated protein RdgC [Betaproteobacteria bacterium]